jgi:hypothetical protein
MFPVISMFRCKSQLEQQNFGLAPRLEKSTMLFLILESTTECSLIIESWFLLVCGLKYCNAKVSSSCVFGVESPVGLSISWICFLFSSESLTTVIPFTHPQTKKSMYVSNDRTDDKLKKVKIAFFACIVIALLAVPLGVGFWVGLKKDGTSVIATKEMYDSSSEVRRAATRALRRLADGLYAMLDDPNLFRVTGLCAFTKF